MDRVFRRAARARRSNTPAVAIILVSNHKCITMHCTYGPETRAEGGTEGHSARYVAAHGHAPRGLFKSAGRGRDDPAGSGGGPRDVAGGESFVQELRSYFDLDRGFRPSTKPIETQIIKIRDEWGTQLHFIS